jgi:hypothetical protein
LCFFALSMTTSLKILGAVIPRRVFHTAWAITGLMHRKKWTDTAATPKRGRQSVDIKRSSTQNVARTPAYAARGMPGTNMRGSLRPRDGGTELGSKNVPVV